MKQQQPLWIRAIDDFLPKDRQKSIIALYRARALVRTAIMGSVLHPFLYLFENGVWDAWLQGVIALFLFAFPWALIWFYRHSGRLRLCAGIYLVFCTAICSVAQYTSGTMHAQYWLWYTFLIVFSVLELGVKIGGVYSLLLTILAVWILADNQGHGHVIGRFENKDTLLASMAAQVIALQVCFLLLMTAYDAIRGRAETRAVMLRFSDEETDRLAAIGERIGGMAHELNEQLNQYQGQILRLDVLAKRSDTKVEDLQKLVSELQQRSQKLGEISKISNG